MAKFSPLCMPRPPEMTILAPVSSGRSDSVSCAPRYLERPDSAVAAMVSTGAEPPSAGAGSKDVMRTVISLMGSLDLTVIMALPA
jgi:hypothetical protein